MRSLVVLAVLLIPSVALGNAADCYWLLGYEEGLEDLTIKVIYESGHSVCIGVGDYLPVGCNVASYVTCESTIGTTKGDIAYRPACCGGACSSAVSIQSFNSPPNTGVSILGVLSCGGSCPADNCSSTDPGKPPPGSHPNPGGDDDNDGIRNECDPDEVACVDADSDGCCDSCGDDCSPDDEDGDDDDDDDGIRNECDTDEQPCIDANEDGCCDHCGDECEPPCDPLEDCCEGEAGYPDCCDPETDCCPGEEGYPDCDCDPETECCPGEEGYPDCPDECGDCDPCEKLDQIASILQDISEGGGFGAPGGYTPVMPEIDPVIPGSPPDDLAFEGANNVLPDELPDFGSPSGGHLTIPVPGVGGEGVSLSFGARPLEDFAQAYLPGGTLGTAFLAVDNMRQAIRLVLLFLVSWSFCKRVYNEIKSI